jgi:DNA/RNA endonuclease G (NUC1)
VLVAVQGQPQIDLSSRPPWLGLEAYLQDNVADNGRRLVVFTGPISGGTDPVYRDVQIPLKFLEVAAFTMLLTQDARG